jgi:hypothetical protein
MPGRVPANIAVIMLTRWRSTNPVQSHPSSAYAFSLLDICKREACDLGAAGSGFLEKSHGPPREPDILARCPLSAESW